MNVPDDPLLAALRVAFARETGDAPRGRVSVRYDVREEIAHGGMGIVWRGFDLELAREVAIKTLQPGLDAHDAIVLRFANEARITGRLQHPGIVPVYEHGRLPDGRPFLTMKLIGGETLQALLAARGAASDRRRLLAIFEQVVQTLGYAHSEGIVHRDLKPANVMVGAFGEVQVVDWGLALDLRGDGSGERGVVGTKGYMAPEQERGESVDARADVWALGTILRELVGEHPDPELLALVAACRAEDKAQRPQDAGELARRLNAHLSAFDARARRAEERRRTRPLRLSLATAILLVLALGTLGVVRVVHDRHARTDQELTQALDDLRARWDRSAEPADLARADAGFARAFRERAVDVDAIDQAAAVAALRSDRLAAELAQALDFWAFERESWKGQDKESWQRLVRIANAIDPDSRTKAVRAAIHASDLPRLRELAAASRPEDLPAGTWTLLGNALRVFGDADSGFAALERAWDQHPGDFWVCFYLGHWNQQKKPPRDDEGLRYFTAMVALRPDSGVAHSELGSALLAQGRLDEAAAEYGRAIKLCPRFAGDHVNLSIVLRKKGEMAGAIEACRRAVELDPDAGAAWVDLSTMLANADDHPGAMVALRRVIALRPDDALAHFNLGVLVHGDGGIDEALAEFSQTLRIAPKHARAHMMLGQCLLARGLPGPALEHLTKGRELAVENEWDQTLDEVIGQCEALVELEKLPEADRDAKARVALGGLELARKEGRKALALFESAFAQDPALCNDIKAGTRYSAACAAALCGERAKALAWLQQDLLRWDQLLATGSPAAKRAARKMLAQWQKDPDLASLRTDEIWNRVAALLEGEQQ